MSGQCTATRKDGTPCLNRALTGSDRCRWHRDVETPPAFSLTWEVKPDLFQFLFKHAQALAGPPQRGLDTLIIKSTFAQGEQPDIPREEIDRKVIELNPGSYTMTLPIQVTFHRDPEVAGGICFVLGGNRITMSPAETFSADDRAEQHAMIETIEERNVRFGLALPSEGADLAPAAEAGEKVSTPASAGTAWHVLKTDSIPQYTFHEARTVAIAIADARSGNRWETIEGEIAVRHVIPGEPLQTKFAAGPLSGWWGSPLSQEGLLEELRKMEFTGVLLYHVGLHMVLQSPHVTVSLDDIIREIGWEPRSSVQRQEMQRRIWLWLTYFDGMKVIGRRPGRYRDPHTGRELDLTSVDALLRITGTRMPTRGGRDGEEVPVEVTITAGPWLDQYRGNRQILSDFGNIRHLAAIPAGKPSGAWAQSVGLALYQRWRERATRTEVAYVGEDNHPTVRGQHFTRRDLLGLFRCDPYVEDVLASDHPGRARQYWTDAIAELKHAGLIGYYKELEPLKGGRKGWQESWLEQPLDIRPARDEARAIEEISRTAGKRRKSSARAKNSASFE